MSHAQKEIVRLKHCIAFYKGELARETKQVAATQADLDLMTEAEREALPSGYGYKFKTVPVTEQDRALWRRMIAGFQDDLRRYI